MEIGPIVGIRPIAVIQPPSRSPDLTGVFSIEFRGQQDETYTAANQRAARGLEDEEADEESMADAGEPAAEEITVETRQQSEPPRRVNFFA